MKRLPAAVLLAIGLASLGFWGAGGVAAEFMARAGRGGFDGAATVAVCALGGALAGFAAAVVLAVRLALPSLVRWAAVALLLGMACAAFSVWRGARRGNPGSSRSHGADTIIPRIVPV